MFGAAVLLCVSAWTCEVNWALKSSLKPVNSAPGVFVVSKMPRPRLSNGRKYCIATGRPFVQDSSAAAAAASSLDGGVSGAAVVGVAAGLGGGTRPAAGGLPRRGGRARKNAQPPGQVGGGGLIHAFFLEDI